MRKPFYFASFIIILLLLGVSCLLVLIRWFFAKDLSSSKATYDLYSAENESFMDYFVKPLIAEAYSTFVLIIKPIFVIMVLSQYSSAVRSKYAVNLLMFI